MQVIIAGPTFFPQADAVKLPVDLKHDMDAVEVLGKLNIHRKDGALGGLKGRRIDASGDIPSAAAVRTRTERRNGRSIAQSKSPKQRPAWLRKGAQ